MPSTKVSLYYRDGSGYHRCDPRRIYGKGTVFVLRFVGDDCKRVWKTLQRGTGFADARKAALEKELALGDPVKATPSLKHRPVAKSPDGRVRIADAVDAYINALWEEKNLCPRTIKDKHQELKRWAGWLRDERKKEYVEDIGRMDMLEFRDWLFDDGCAPWTVKTNMLSAATMLKHNPLLPVTGLLKRGDWPKIEDGEPKPYTPAEVKAMISACEDDRERLFVRFLVGSGCREMEIAHLEWSDFHWAEKTVRIKAKAKWGWKPKTKAGTRTIPLSDSLMAELKRSRKKDGLVFPAKRGGIDYHKLRLIQAIAGRAGVEHAGLHRGRDTFATEALRQHVDLITVAEWLGHKGLGAVRLYMQALRAKDKQARDAVNRMADLYAADIAADQAFAFSDSPASNTSLN